MWSGTVGLVNGQGKYLTAEMFGYKINATGTALKKKQLWSIEPFPLEEKTVSNGNSSFDEPAELEHVAIKSHLGCYLAVDNFGNVTCQDKELSKYARFTITICSMSGPGGDGEQIYWGLRNVERGYFLGATFDGTVTCTAKMPQSKSELWHVHLLPARGSTMFAFKSVSRKRFARTFISTIHGKVQIQMDTTEPWGAETLYQLKYFDSGRYAFLTSDCKYLTCDGACVEWNPTKNGSNGLPPIDAMYTIEYHGGNIAFRDYQGRYLAGTGRPPILRTREMAVSRDELFDMVHAPLQIALRANTNGKWVSIKQGYDVSANQRDITGDHETFELEHEQQGMWLIRTKEGKYWSLGAASAIQTSSADRKLAGHFLLKWREDGSCNILVSSKPGENEASMKWVCARKSGQLYFGGQDPVGFFVVFQNRTTLNLRATTASGFVGLKLPNTSKLEANKTVPDSIVIEYSDNSDDEAELDAGCYFKMPTNNKYWSVIDGNQVACDSTTKACAQQFYLELRDSYSIAIRLSDSPSYVSLTTQGQIVVKNCSPNEATLWDF